MPHCKICDFDEKTGTPSNYYSDLGFSNNKVKFYEDWDGFFCMECRETSKLNSAIYRAEEEREKEEPQKEAGETFDWKQHVNKKTPALSEV